MNNKTGHRWPGKSINLKQIGIIKVQKEKITDNESP
jgi:hypothetical protein